MAGFIKRTSRSNTHTYDRYKYNKSHGSQYIRDVSEKIQSESDSILNPINNSKVNEALDKLMNCIFLMKQTHVDHTDTHRKQPCFDKSCKDMKTKTLRALRFFRQTLTERALNAYLLLKNSYRNLTRRKKGDYIANRTAKLNSACNEKNARIFWNVLKEHKAQVSPSISAHEWFDYFSNLYNIESQSEILLLMKIYRKDRMIF